MMHRLVFFASCIALLGCSGDAPNPVDPGQPARIEWGEGDVIVAMGTSLTFGYGSGCRVLPPRVPCAGDSAYPTLLSADLRLPIVNLAQPRSTTRDGLALLSETLLHNPVLVLLEYGANDLIRGVSVEDARANMQQIIERLHAEGSAVALISALHPDMIESTPTGHRLQSMSEPLLDYHAMVVDLADQYQLPLVEYLFEGIWWNAQLMFDELHPNGRGYLIMKENVLSSLRGFLAANEMI